MGESVYKIIEIVGTSEKSWEDAAKNAVETASKSLRELRIAEVSKLDMKIEKGKVVAYRARVSISFKYGSDQKLIAFLKASIVFMKTSGKALYLIEIDPCRFFFYLFNSVIFPVLIL